MTELMKRYIKETGESIQIRGTLMGRNYAAWLEKQLYLTVEEVYALKAQLTWRPVSEKPKEGQIVFVMVSTGWFVAQYIRGGFYVDDGFTFGDFISGVSHWLPIPPAPEGEAE